jgi:hypothetical protein
VSIPELRLPSFCVVNWVAPEATTRQSARVPMTKEQFVDDLTRRCPEARPLVDEHVHDHGEILLHLVAADVLRLATAMFNAGATEELHRCLGVVATGLTDGDEYVQNAISVSFVEDTPWWDEHMAPFMAAWPEALRAEAETYRIATDDST